VKNMVTVAGLYLRAREEVRSIEVLLSGEIQSLSDEERALWMQMLHSNRARQELLADILEIDEEKLNAPVESPALPLAKVEIFPALAYGHYVVCIPANPQAIVPHYEHAFFITVEHFEQLIETGQRVLREARECANPSSIVAEQATE